MYVASNESSEYGHLGRLCTVLKLKNYHLHRAARYWTRHRRLIAGVVGAFGFGAAMYYSYEFGSRVVLRDIVAIRPPSTYFAQHSLRSCVVFIEVVASGKPFQTRKIFTAEVADEETFVDEATGEHSWEVQSALSLQRVSSLDEIVSLPCIDDLTSSANKSVVLLTSLTSAAPWWSSQMEVRYSKGRYVIVYENNSQELRSRDLGSHFVPAGILGNALLWIAAFAGPCGMGYRILNRVASQIIRKHPWLCHECGYNLTHGQSRCPECGKCVRSLC
jgi:hypothetical protein